MYQFALGFIVCLFVFPGILGYEHFSWYIRTRGWDCNTEFFIRNEFRIIKISIMNSIDHGSGVLQFESGSYTKTTTGTASETNG